MKQYIISSAVFALALVAGGLWAMDSVRAQSVTAPADGSNGNSLRISPVRSDIMIDRGNSKSVEVYIENTTSQTVTLRAIMNDFVSGGENGEASLVLDEDEYAPTHSLKRFMQPVPNVTVEPRSRQKVNVVIAVPETAQPGGYFGAVRFAPAVGADGQLAVSGSVASLILLRVPGDYRESLELTEFALQQDGKSTSRLTNGDHLTALVRVENKGNVQVEPFGGVFVTKNGQQVYSAQINEVTPPGSVLPDSIRRFEVPIEGMDGFGKYTVSLALTYGGSNETIMQERTVWVIPTTYIVIGLAVLAFVVITIAAIIVMFKSYKRKILRQARRR